MCGIAGIVATAPIGNLTAVLEGFSAGLAHRGPDDVGFLTWAGDAFALGRRAETLRAGHVALIHRRLSIVDLSERGWQPMTDASGRYAIVLNGEIYNYPELRRELEAEGVAFRSTTDTEVLLNLLIRSGTDALRRVVGMFAFAFCDTVRRRLWIARDPFGIKPLFYSCDPAQFSFSSEIRPLLSLGFAPRRVEPSALFDYLRHAVTDHGELTMIAGVRQLLPAHTIEVDLDTGAVAAPKRYWRPSLATRTAPTMAAATEQLRALFTDSIRLLMRADVPIAATLSGGIDSSAIVGMLDRLQHDESLQVFSYVADHPTVNEERYLDMVADAAHVTPRKIRLDPDQLVDELDGLILTQEQPFTTTSMWAQNRVFRRAHEDGFKVIMDGQGADELFAGYPVFRAARLATMLRRGEWVGAAQFVRGLPGSRGIPVQRAIASLLPPRLHETARRMIGKPTVPAWLNADWFVRHAAASVRPHDGGGAPTDLVAELYDATVSTSLPMLLRYADRNAMSVSLENRVPFLTTAMADFALSLPDALLIGPDGTTKQLLRAAMRGIVPDAVLERRDKIGFATPEAHWFATTSSLRERLNAAIPRALPPCFQSGVLERLAAVAAGRAPYSGEIWRCWNVLRWAQLLRLEFPS
jgi:asparagine synthase (glutamine-hydrolysing)